MGIKYVNYLYPVFGHVVWASHLHPLEARLMVTPGVPDVLGG